jgi:hypothetical protein
VSAPNSHDIKILNGLAEGLTDSADGYAQASAETSDPRYRELFVRRSDERRRIAAELQAAVRGMGGQSEDEGSILAKAQRAFADIKHALMRDEALSATTRETLRRALAAVRSGHEEMHVLRRSLEGQQDADNPLYPQ